MSVRSFDEVVCIQGPTASGKSSLAEAIAMRLGGEIVSADSMQVYRGMDIGTAKVPVGDRGVRYHCIDLIDPGQAYSAAEYQRDARNAMDEVRRRGKTSVLCGGTGLYVRAALDDMDFAAGDGESLARQRYSALADEIGAEALHELLAQRDPQSARLIHPNNVRRVIRAFEMLEEGESYARRKESFKRVPPRFDSVKLALDVDRPLLYERINERVDEMLEAGLVDEVRSLLDAGFREGITAPQAIGYKEIVEHLDGRCALEEASDAIKQATRRYAKRQLSWLRGDPEIVWLRANEGITDTLVERALHEIERAHEV